MVSYFCTQMMEKRLIYSIPFILIGFLFVITKWRIVTSNEKNYSLELFEINTKNSSVYNYPMHLLPQDDYKQVIDLNFSFSILNLVCNHTTPLLLVMVHSAPRNYAKRKTIRETWGKNNEAVRIVFVIGSVNDSEVQAAILQENEQHNDFIQGNFLDTYRNITYKHVMLFKYVIYHCPKAKYILKTDDDVFVNMPSMEILLNSDLSPYGAKKILFCTIRRGVTVVRTYRSKWRVSFKEYPYKTYPTYCPGWNLLYSPDVVFSLYKEAQKADYFWIDDIHITGTLAKKVNISHTDIQHLVISKYDIENIVDKSMTVTDPFLYGPSDSTESQIKSLWNYATSHLPPKSVFRKT